MNTKNDELLSVLHDLYNNNIHIDMINPETRVKNKRTLKTVNASELREAVEKDVKAGVYPAYEGSEFALEPLNKWYVVEEEPYQLDSEDILDSFFYALEQNGIKDMDWVNKARGTISVETLDAMQALLNKDLKAGGIMEEREVKRVLLSKATKPAVEVVPISTLYKDTTLCSIYFDLKVTVSSMNEYITSLEDTSKVFPIPHWHLTDGTLVELDILK